MVATSNLAICNGHYEDDEASHWQEVITYTIIPCVASLHLITYHILSGDGLEHQFYSSISW